MKTAKEINEDLDYLFGKINWKTSWLDGEAIFIMNSLRGDIHALEGRIIITDSIIDDKNMTKEIVNDLIETYKLSEESAAKWAKEHGASLVDTMWDAYTHYLEDHYTD